MNPKQLAYAARRAAHAGYTPPAGVVTRPVAHVGTDASPGPVSITYHVSQEAEVVEMLRRAGLRFADAPEEKGAFW